MTIRVRFSPPPGGCPATAWLFYFLLSFLRCQALLSPLSSVLFSDLTRNSWLSHPSSPLPKPAAAGPSVADSLSAKGRHATSAEFLQRLALLNQQERYHLLGSRKRILGALLNIRPNKGLTDSRSDRVAPERNPDGVFHGTFLSGSCPGKSPIRKSFASWHPRPLSSGFFSSFVRPRTPWITRLSLNNFGGRRWSPWNPTRQRHWVPGFLGLDLIKIFGRLADVSTVGSVIASPVSSPATAAPLILGVYENVVDLARSRKEELFHPSGESTKERTRVADDLVSTDDYCGSTGQTEGDSVRNQRKRKRCPEMRDSDRLPGDGTGSDGATNDKEPATTVQWETNWDWDAWLMKEREKWLSGTYQSLLIKKNALVKGRRRSTALSGKKKWEELFDRTLTLETKGQVDGTDPGKNSCAPGLKQGGIARSSKDGNEEGLVARQEKVSGAGAQFQCCGFLHPQTSVSLRPVSGEGLKGTLSRDSQHVIGEGLNRQAFEESLLKSKFIWPLQPNNGAALRSIQYIPARRVRNTAEGHQDDTDGGSGENTGESTRTRGARRHQRKKISTYERVNQLLQASPVSSDAIDCVWRALTRVVTGPFGEVLPPRVSLSCPELEALNDTQGVTSGRLLYRGDFLRSIWEWAPADGLVDWESFLFFLDEVPSDGVEPLFN
uniref:Transmembrane protein n=1 Tax=Toxoplasma gondii COUG TaxID=1074873 RepID=A0A2G8Y1B0_TOXGO|nr:hypothetical protein TGCOUG_315310 [Toxoplasma gondii COUG]